MRGLLAPGRWLRGVFAWVCAALSASLLGATATIAYLMAREAIVAPSFSPSEWWLFINLWRPLLIAGAILVPLFGALPALVVVLIIRRARWPRPAADMIGGAVCGLLSLGLVVTVARIMSTLGQS